MSRFLCRANKKPNEPSGGCCCCCEEVVVVLFGRLCAEMPMQEEVAVFHYIYVVMRMKAVVVVGAFHYLCCHLPKVSVMALRPS